jgi:hypothetical protein
MPSVNFYLNRPFAKGTEKFERTKVLNPSETMVFIYVTYPDRKIIKVSTGEKALAKNWDFDKKCFRSTSAGSLTHNSRLAYFKSEVLQAISRATSQNLDITLPQLRKIVEDTLDGKQPKFIKRTFLEYMNEYLEEKKPLVKTKDIRQIPIVPVCDG